MSFDLDYSSLLATVIGAAGISQEEIDNNFYRLEDAHRTMQTDKLEGKLGFVKLPYQQSELQDILALAEDVRNQCKYLIVIGIGGSDLGARAVHRALNHQFYNQAEWTRGIYPKLHFVGDTTDPVALQEVLDAVDLSESVLVMISKSGNTIEQMSTFLYLRQCLINAVGHEQSVNQIITITDPKSGTLRDITKKEGYRSLPVPEDAGGRFSVFSAVGLFPLAVVGLDIHELLSGARAMDKHNKECSDLTQNLPAYYTYLMYLAYTLRHQSIRVMMPYIYGLREFGFWYRQLWAESLGKAATTDGGSTEVGPTPIASLGPTDQHSQLQLYLEGPINKVVIFITSKESRISRPDAKEAIDLVIPAAFEDIEGASYLAGHRFQDILLAEQKSTAYSLTEAGRPNCHIEIDKLDAFSLGQLIYFFELAVTYGGKFHSINPFDQPAVEIGKRYMYGLLGRPGYEEYKIEELAEQKVIGC